LVEAAEQSEFSSAKSYIDCHSPISIDDFDW